MWFTIVSLWHIVDFLKSWSQWSFCRSKPSKYTQTGALIINHICVIQIIFLMIDLLNSLLLIWNSAISLFSVEAFVYSVEGQVVHKLFDFVNASWSVLYQRFNGLWVIFHNFLVVKHTSCWILKIVLTTKTYKQRRFWIDSSGKDISRSTESLMWLYSYLCLLAFWHLSNMRSFVNIWTLSSFPQKLLNLVSPKLLCSILGDGE